MLCFSDFQFDTEQNILYKNGEVFALNNNQAKLLGLLLSQPEKIFSKNEILDLVWESRPVSEQVVFQNISQLRAIISESAIKTFPKRGYQWHLPLSQISSVSLNKSQAGNHALASRSPYKYTAYFQKWQIMVFVLLLAFFVAYSLYPRSLPIPFADALHLVKKQQNNMVLVPFMTRREGELSDIKQVLNTQLTNTITRSSNIDSEINADAFINSPYMIRKQIVSEASQLVLSGKIYALGIDEPINDQRSDSAPQLLVEYLIQGEYRSWQGYLIADSVSELAKQVKLNVENIGSSKYFELASDSYTTAELSLLHNRSPDNLDILKHLIERLLIEDSYDEAGARIETLLKESSRQNHPIYVAYSHWLKGKLLIGLEQYNLAHQALIQANDLAAKYHLFIIQNEINQSLARVAFANKDFEKVKHHLYQAASQARIANRPVHEIRAYTLMSIYASALGLHNDKYDYLNKAHILLNDYKLDGSHYMLIYYHLALFAETENEEINHYLKILELPSTPENYWIFVKVTNKLAKSYIKQNQWLQALDLADGLTNSALSGYIKAQIYQAQGERTLAKEHAKVSFNSARTQRIDWVGLDMALLLLELTDNQTSEADKLIYHRYIETMANAWWKKENSTRIEKVGAT